MKLLSIVVPAYNSEDYLARCLDSVVQGGPETEVIVVDDGSADRTAEIAREYCARYPDIVRLEQKKNGGHGSAVNRGLEKARGLYFKVVDSDDWLDVPSLRRVLDLLRRDGTVDMVICNYVYEYAYSGGRHRVHYGNALPRGRVFGWEQTRHFRISQLLLMHSLVYRTAVLRESGLHLPEHTFYVDNLVAFLPLPHVRRMIYLDCDLYRYFIGRPDQSVNTDVMIRRIDQQLRVTRLMADAFAGGGDTLGPKLRKYMRHYLEMMVAVSVVHIQLSEDPALQPKADALWEYIRQKDETLYHSLRHGGLNVCIAAARRTGPRATRHGFQLARRIYKFS